MGTFVKICGLARAEDAQHAARSGADALGFVFWPPSPRSVAPGDVGAWSKDLPGDLPRVGVFVDASRDELERAVEEAGLTAIQLHGKEPPALCEGWGGIEVWKCIHLNVQPASDASAYPVETVLFDRYSQQLPGGSGMQLDWTVAREAVQQVRQRSLLAGGLNADNVARAISQVRPFGVDVSSGVEAEPGKKDHANVEAFIQACKAS